MPNKRSIGKLELKLARNYAYQHSQHTTQPDKPKETIFLDEQDRLREYVIQKARETRTGHIPEIPQGTVLNSQLTDLFDFLKYNLQTVNNL